MNLYFLGILAALVVFFAVGIGAGRMVKDTNDYYVSGRNAPTLLIVGSLIASFLSTGAFLGDTGEVYSGFFIGIVTVGVIQATGYIYGAGFFGRYIRRSEVTTLPEYFGRRFCSKHLRRLSAVILLVSVSAYLLSAIQGVATLMSSITGYNYRLCAVIVWLAFTAFTIYSGSPGVLLTDTIMFLVFLAAALVAVPFLIRAGGGWFAGIEALANSDTMPHDIAFLGEVCDNPYPMDSQKERRKLILTNKNYAGHKLRDLKTLRTDGIIISRISRLGFTFVPTGETTLERNDVLTVVGTPENLTKYGDKIGHRSQDMNQTDLLSLGFGLSLGIILGLVNFSLGNGAGISLGIAGGPLIVALLLGHFGRLGPIVGYIPRPTRLLLQDLGLVFFLADAGIKGGADLVDTVATHGAAVFIMGVIVTCSGMFAGYFVGMKVFKMNILECLGGICGGMTSTPALGAIASKTDSQAPVVSYATAYPVALILMTIIAKVIIQTIGGVVGI